MKREPSPNDTSPEHHRFGATTKQLLDHATHLYETGELRAAARLCRKALTEEPENPHALHLLGTVTHELGDHRAAIWFIKKALRRAPQCAVFYASLARAQVALGLDEAALASRKMARELARRAA